MMRGTMAGGACGAQLALLAMLALCSSLGSPRFARALDLSWVPSGDGPLPSSDAYRAPLGSRHIYPGRALYILKTQARVRLSCGQPRGARHWRTHSWLPAQLRARAWAIGRHESDWAHPIPVCPALFRRARARRRERESLTC